MRRNLSLTVILTALLLASGCVYQAALSQGNLLDQDDVDQAEVGMTKGQIRFLLGTPMIDDPFHENRWDYIYYLRIGREKGNFSSAGYPSILRAITSLRSSGTRNSDLTCRSGFSRE